MPIACWISASRDRVPRHEKTNAECRNVLIYFDQDTKSDVLRRLAGALSSDGYLVLGAAETAVGLCDRFKMVSDKPGLYTVNTIGPRLLAQPRTTHARPRLIAINGGR